MSTLTPNALQAKITAIPGLLVLDLRSPDEFAQGAIAGAKNLHWSPDLAEKIAARVPRSTEVVFVCAWGHKSAIATIALRREGFRHVSYLDGGLEAWGLAGMSLAKAEHPAAAP